ncbi:hypothetical protein K7640_17055 [Micromonospora sp. PLK6-60]|uniref:hypothetical protein n=1 Tax=Micromonospora sp. PLK6-60 TaxID=2873383 RepID=UPI001CA73EA6|nr:hypothetical protein [Micromonospora sp. PLK6-60]MBY8873546.1 hypothetical protein [Micromonospora sp. PLK6-60]
MTTAVVSLVAFVLILVAVVVVVARRDRNRLSSAEDPTAIRQAGADQHRHEAERHFASGLAERQHTPNP